MSTGPAGHVTRSFAVPNSETADRAPLRRFLTTDDGVTIDAVYEPGGLVYDGSAPPSGNPSDRVAIVVAHGFTGDADRPHVRRVAEVFAQYGAVVTFSFRGHGASGGRSTVGDREVLDLAAAVRWARELGHTRVATVGFSMGGSVVLRHAALYGDSGRQEHEGRTGAASDVVVSVSAPARWYYRGTAPMRRVHWLITRPEGRLVGRYGLRTRIHHRDWNPVPLSPVEAAARIAPRPLLIVHGDRDGYFPVDHPRMLAEAAGDAGELWLEPGMGHAEHAAGEELLRRIADWAVAKAG
ncbi:alpha/beta hydrolase [Streptomyces sp. WI04-05B]|uniref:alpha/beta hydrolase n=1 Tax=Streptomyces TaxID=1883 RepID=UPI0029B2546C|nr:MULTISPECIES: alpha/beta fold hydrolase [unclassified Streptomyces]MDX2544840.1 alpha/beta fold hydrolase [Streptomyces sp. WI04-05B]MDX2588888.1 alpha/beta fold hydrolase [Streptomyces sp. WI04-05A]